MARETNPNRTKAQQIFLEYQGEITNRRIAEMLGEKEKTISAWKSRDKWNAALQNGDCSTAKENRSTTKKEKQPKAQSPPETIEDSEAYELTPKQRIFVQEYLLDMNATQAAIRAGYSADTAHVQGPRLLNNVRVRAAIKEAQEARQKRTGVTADRVIEQIAKIAFVDMRDLVTWDEKGIKIRPSEEIDGTVLAEISESISEQGSIQKKIKINDRMRALDMLAKHTGLLDEHKRKMDEAKIELAKERIKIEREKFDVPGDENKELVDDWVESVMEIDGNGTD